MLQLDVEEVISGRVRVLIQEVYRLLGFVHLGLRGLHLVAIVNSEVFLVAEHVDLFEHFPLEVGKRLVPDLELECLLIEQLELDGEALRKLLLCDAGQARLKAGVTFLLLGQYFILQRSHVVALVLLVDLRED